MTDRDLVRLYWPVELRSAFDALWAIDDALAHVVTSSSQPALGAIRLAWWREALEKLDHHPAPPEPRLQAVVAELLPRGISGAALAGLEDGWATLLDEEPDGERVRARGEALFAMGGTLLGGDDPGLAPAGRLYAYQQVVRKGLMPADPSARETNALARKSFHRQLRPLTALALLAARDARQSPRFEPEATPGRAVALLAHRLTGRGI